jgi:hypothetical protein
VSAGPWDQPRRRLRLDDRPRDVWMHRLDPVGEQAASEMDWEHRKPRRKKPRQQQPNIRPSAESLGAITFSETEQS